MKVLHINLNIKLLYFTLLKLHLFGGFLSSRSPNQDE